MKSILLHPASRLALVLFATIALASWKFVPGQAMPAGSSIAEGVEEKRVMPVQVIPVAISDSYTVTDKFLGEVEVARRSELGFELAGILSAVHYDEGGAG